MKRYDFGKTIPRRDTASYKWDSLQGENILPMWVADMDFRTSEAIIKALEARVRHGIFGYVRVPDRYYEAVAGWFGRKHGWELRREWIMYTSGVVPAISAAIKALTRPGDAVLVMTPVYNCFFSSIRNNGCRIVSSPLIYDGNRYTVSYSDLEEKASDPEVKVLLLCNPHNPAGRVWTREELSHIGRICEKTGITVISDEIHCELVMPGHEYTPYASVDISHLHHSVTLVSPSKAFNLAGLQIASIITSREDFRERIDRALNINEVCDVNPFGVEATVAAYTHGEEWLEQLLEYIAGNYSCFKSFFSRYLPGITVTELEGTYLVWTDCRSLGMTSDELQSRLLSETGLWLNSGTLYGPEGEGFLRWNIACPRSALEDALSRFRTFVSGLKI